ncbi:MAG: hypothetical protein AAGD13_18535 [Pseudomonadota bacterium]
MSDQDKRPENIEDADLDEVQGAGSIISKVDDPAVAEFQSSDFKSAKGANNGEGWNVKANAMGNAGNGFHGSDFNASKGAMGNSSR